MLDTVVMSGDDVCCSVVFGTLVGVYSSSTLVGLKHPVINLHASFSSESSLEACGDLAHTGHAYSAAE